MFEQIGKNKINVVNNWLLFKKKKDFQLYSMGVKGKWDKLNYLDMINYVVNQITHTHLQTQTLYSWGTIFIFG